MEVEPEGDVEAGGPVETHASDFPGKDGTCAQVSSVSSSPCGHLDAAALRNGHSVFTPGSNAVLSSQFPSSPPSSSPSSSPSSPSASCLGTREKSDSRSLTSGHLNGSAADAESPGTRGGDSAVSRDGREDSMGKLQMLLEYGESYLLSLCHHSRKQEATRQFSASREAVESGAASGLGPCGEKAVGSGPSRRSRRVVSSDDEDGPDFEEGKSGEDARRARKRRRGPEEGSPYLEEEFRSRPVITRLSTHPSILRCPPKPYQLEGLNWLIQLHERGMNGILADEMGLGKTYQTISLLAFLKEGKGVDGPHLVLAPKSTIGNWMTEFRKFCPSINAVRVLGDKETRRRTLAHIVSRTQASSFPFSFPGEKTLRSESSPESEEEKSDDETQKDLKGAERPDEDGEEGAKEEKEEDDGVLPDRVDVVVTSFEMCILERAQFLKVDWEYIIIDEAHRIKNESSKLAQTARLFNTKHRLLLTGTPLQNNLRELWALLNFLFPSLFSSSAEFEHLFDLTGTGEAGSEMTAEEREERNMKIVTRLHRILRPFMLRRVKKEVLKEMPPKKELLLVVPLSAMQKQLYKDLLTKNVAALQGAEGAGRTQLLNLAMQLRKACNHPYLFDGYESEHADPFGEHVIENAGKLRFCDRLLRRLIQENRRCLIFTQMTKMIDILEDYCRIRLFKYCRIDGNTSGDERDRQIEAFNAPGSDIPIFLLSTRAGGLGINLATADTVILYDSDWNPQVDLQAMDRVHRIGQKSAVNVYRLVHEHTIEQKIIERAMLKLQLDTAIIQQGRLSDQQNQQKQLSKNELMTMVQFGADHIFKSGAGEDVTEEELEAILA
ncbi:SWI2/SNF2 ISWI-like SANT, partial [Toxoplasma gondii CAST]